MLNINETIKQLLILIRGQKESGDIKIYEVYEEGLPELFADKNQLQQVFLNLLLNSGEAISGAGVITITTSKTQDARNKIQDLNNKQYTPNSIIVTLSDTGSGISEEEYG